MFAVIETGGKQYVVLPGEKIKTEKLDVSEGSEVLFDKVLLKETDSGIEIGYPYLESSIVKGKILNQGRDEKKIVFKFHSKNRFDKKKTHRQAFSEVEIISIA
ncbi:MAG: 50S ribosomal protein L21 [Parcubacteria group bacterium]